MENLHQNLQPHYEKIKIRYDNFKLKFQQKFPPKKLIKYTWLFISLILICIFICLYFRFKYENIFVEAAQEKNLEFRLFKGINIYFLFCIIIVLTSIVIWFINPLNTIEKFFGKKPKPFLMCKYIGTLCGAVLIIGNFIIFNDNNKLQIGQLENQLEEIRIQQEYYKSIDDQQKRMYYNNAVNNLLSSADAKILYGFSEVFDYYLAEAEKKNDTLHVLNTKIPNDLAKFVTIHNRKPYIWDKKKDIGKLNINEYKYDIEKAISYLADTNFYYIKEKFDLENLYFNNIDFKDCHITSQVGLDYSIFANMKFYNVTFYLSSMIAVEFYNVEFENCVFQGFDFNRGEDDDEPCIFNNCRFKECELFDISFNNTHFDDVSFKGINKNKDNEDEEFTSMSNVTFIESEIKNVRFEVLQIDELDIDSTCTIEPASITFTKTNLDEHLKKHSMNEILKNTMKFSGIQEATIATDKPNDIDIEQINETKPVYISSESFPVETLVIPSVLIALLVIFLYWRP